jgi:hypothetical protein
MRLLSLAAILKLGALLNDNASSGGSNSLKLKDFLLISLLTFGALLINGYHPGAEDAEIYLPGIEKMLHPELFPFNPQFFEPHAHSTLFPNLIAASVRLSHLRLETAILVWHVVSIFLLLLACWQLSVRCFNDPKARWASVALVAALLTLPVAGTALYIMDQYLNPRNLVAFAAIFAIVKMLDEKYLQAALFLLFAGAIHPLMSVFSLSFCLLLVGMKKLSLPWFAVLLPFGISFAPPPKAYHQAALTHSYFYLTRWQWYEWLGVIGPLAILVWFSRLARARKRRIVDLLCRALLIYQLGYVAVALLISIPARFEALARLQPMRSLYLLYILMLLLGGGVLAELVLKNHIWRWLVLFVPLCVGMFVTQRILFPASAHIEWPWAHPRNPWVQAFLWVRNNTPPDAVFALDPDYADLSGEDEQGFRAIARRSRTADAVKDSGAVSMFPQMADEWSRQVQAQLGWSKFQLQDFRRLQAEYGVNWVVLQQPGLLGLDCPYSNQAVLVCKL